MGQEQATMSLPMDLVKPAIDAQVNAAVLKALGSVDGLIEKFVEKVAGQLVDSEGKSSSYRDSKPWFTWAVEEMVKDALKKAMVEHLAKDKDKLTAAIEAEMRRSKSPLVRALIDGMAKGFAEKLASCYHVSISFGG